MRHISHCLNDQLTKIIQQALQLKELNEKVNQYLPESLRKQCQVGSFNKGCLILTTQDPVWASQLRYSLPKLRNELRIKGGIHQLTSIKIAIVSNPTPKEVNRLNTPPLSDQAREIIRVTANECHYSPLKKAWLQLAEQKKK